MKYVGVSLKTLHDKFGENLKYGKIKKSIEGNQEYYDLYTDGILTCMDGERCKVSETKGIDKHLVEDMVILHNLESGLSFCLSKKEVDVGVFN